MAGQGTADTAERTGAPLAPVQVASGDSQTPWEVGQLTEQIYSYMMGNPIFAPIQPYPEFVRQMARYQAQTGTIAEPWMQWEWGQKYGVPADVLSPKQGGMGSGVNTANVIRSYETAILNRSMSLGMKLSPEQISYIARVAQAQDFSQEQLMSAIVNLADFKSLQSGSLTATVDEVKAMAKSYLVNVSDQTLQDYAKQIASGQATPEGIKSYIRAQAKAMNPWLSTYIDAGVDPAEVLRASRDTIAKSLGLDVNAVDFTNDRFLKLATIADEKTGTRLANNQELIKNIRSDSAWASTNEARNATTDLVGMISKIFGRSVF